MAQGSSDLELTKTVNNTTPQLNETITFSIQVYNRGQLNNEFTVIDTLPVGWVPTNISTNFGYYSLSGNTITWNTYLNIDILPNQTVTLTYDATVTSCGDYSNTAEIIWAFRPDPDSTPGNGN